MARKRGNFNFSSNFEVKAKAPLDAKQLVHTYSELISPSTWEDLSNDVWLFNGALVSVANDPNPVYNGLYFLNDADNYTSPSSWVKQGAFTGSSVTGVNGLYTVNSIIKLGGNLIENTTIDGEDSYDLKFININDIILSNTNNVSTLNINNNGVKIEYSGRTVNFNSASGLTYGGDYSMDYNDRSLVDKAYIDNEIYSTSLNYVTNTVFNNYTGGTLSILNGKLDTNIYELYTGSTAVIIDNKLNTTDFNNYTGDTQSTFNNKLSISDFNVYSGDTDLLIDTKLDKIVFDNYVPSSSAVTINNPLLESPSGVAIKQDLLNIELTNSIDAIRDNLARLASASCTIRMSNLPSSLALGESIMAFEIVIPSNDTNLIALDDPNNRVNLLVAGRYTWLTSLVIENTKNQEVDIIIRSRSTATGNPVLTERMVSIADKSIETAFTSVIYDIAEGDEPVELYITLQPNKTGVVVNMLDTTLSVGGVTSDITTSWNDLTDKPTTLLGYGITDDIALKPWVQTNFAKISGDSTQDFTLNNLTIHGTVNHWLGDTITIDDANLQLNAVQNSARVSSGLIIYDSDNLTQLSKLHYDTNNRWRLDLDYIATESWVSTQINDYTPIIDWNNLINKPSAFTPTTHTHQISQITNLQVELNSKKPNFSENSAFNKNFGTAAGTVAQGNDSRIINGQTAYGWGNHNGLYLGINDTAVDSNKLGTRDATEYPRKSANERITGLWTIGKSGMLGTLKGDYNILTEIVANGGTTNILYNRKWGFKQEAGFDWVSWSLHDGISVDNSYNTPGVNTRVWYDRYPNKKQHSWGDSAKEFARLVETSGVIKYIVDGNVEAKTGDFSVGLNINTKPVATQEWSNTQYLKLSDNRITNWNTAYGWGNHASAGYIKTYTDTTYSAGAGLTLTGTVFSLPITTSGTGTFVKSLTQTANGVTANLDTPPNTIYTHPTTSGYKHIPAGGSTGQILRWSAVGTAAWETSNTAFNKDFGTTTGTVAQGDDSRIINGKTAYDWGNHASIDYARKGQNEVITGNWSFNDNDNVEVKIGVNNASSATSRTSSILLGRSLATTEGHFWRLQSRSTSAWANNPTFTIGNNPVAGGAFTNALTILNNRNVGLGIDNPLDGLHVKDFIRTNRSFKAYGVYPGIEFFKTDTNRSCRWVLGGSALYYQVIDSSSEYISDPVSFSLDAPTGSFRVNSTGSVTTGSDLYVGGNVTANNGTFTGLKIGTNNVATQAELNAKENTIEAGTTAQYWRGDKSWQILNTTVVPEGTNLYHTNARVKAYADTLYSPLAHTHTPSQVGLGNVGNYSDYARKGQNETITGNWTFLSGENTELAINHSLDATAKNRSASLILGRNAASNLWRMSSQSNQVWGNFPNLHFENKTTDTGAWNKRVTILFNGNVGINNAAPTETLHVVGSGLFTGDIYSGANKVALQNVSILAGNGLTGGGDLSSNKTIKLGTPSTITNSSTNSVTASTHTHAIDLRNLNPNYPLLDTNGLSVTYRSETQNPTSTWAYSINAHNNYNSTGRRGFTLSVPHNSDALYFRGVGNVAGATLDNNYFGNWLRVYTDNYHPDADKLGGVVASDYARKGQNETITGSWNFPGLNIGASENIVLQGSTGKITAADVVLSGNLTSNSDIRKKENLKSIDNVLDKVLILKPTKYNFKDDESKRERIGLIAQELQEEFPQFVEEDDTEDKYLSVDYAGISVIAIKAIQELNKIVKQQGMLIKELEDKIDGLCN